MKKFVLIILAFYFFKEDINAQDLFIYHPEKDVNGIVILNSKNNLFNRKPLHLKQGEKFKVKLINPNPILYKYEITYEAQKEESEDQSVLDAFALLSTVLTSRMVINRVDGSATKEVTYETYKDTVNNLIKEYNRAQEIIKESDKPELLDDAKVLKRTGGLRYAIDQITGNVFPGTKQELSKAKYHFLSPTLADDLKGLLGQVAGLDDMTIKALTLLNENLVQKVEGLKKNIDDVKSVIDTEFIVTDKRTKVFLTIKPVDSKNTSLLRYITKDNEKIEIAEIVPDFKRAILELVPMGVFAFQKDVKEFYLDNNIVKSHLTNPVVFTPGLVINANAFQFGPTNEMAIGFGAGYKASTTDFSFNHFYLSSLFSYKNFFRVGAGLGWSQVPSGLKDGALENQPLPNNIANLNDVITYKDQGSIFLTITFAGLDLTKKK